MVRSAVVVVVVVLCLLAAGSAAEAQEPYNLAVPVRRLATLFTDLYGPQGLIVDSLATLPGQKGEWLDHLHPGSWINANYGIWIGHEEDNLSWDT